MSRFVVGFAVLLMLVCSGFAAASVVIQVNFKGPAAAYTAPGNWNNVGSPPNTTFSNLKDFNTGLATDVDLTTSGWYSSSSSDTSWIGGNKGWMIEVAGDSYLYDYYGSSANGTASAKFSSLSGAAYTVEVVAVDRLDYVYDVSIGGVFADANHNGTPAVDGDNFHSKVDGRDPSNWLIWSNVVPVGGEIQIDFDAGNVTGTHFTINALRLVEAPIPEPTTFLIWSLLAGLGVGWRRRN